jgi:hypothetical protein
MDVAQITDEVLWRCPHSSITTGMIIDTSSGDGLRVPLRFTCSLLRAVSMELVPAR